MKVREIQIGFEGLKTKPKFLEARLEEMEIRERNETMKDHSTIEVGQNAENSPWSWG